MKTKTELLLATLKGRPNEFVDLPYLAAVVGTFDVRTRVARLREQGHSIENKITNEGRTRHSSYRLVVEPPTYRRVNRDGFAPGEVVVEVSRHGHGCALRCDPTGGFGVEFVERHGR